LILKTDKLIMTANRFRFCCCD